MNTSEHFPESFYRVSVKGLYVRDEKLLLMRESSNKSERWELPGGGLDFGEEPRAGLEREVEEEMGLNVVSVAPHPTYVWTTRFEQKRGLDWFYSIVLAYRIDFEHLHFTPSDDCTEIGFFSPSQLHEINLHPQSQRLRELFDPSNVQPPH